MTTYEIHALDPGLLDEVRRSGTTVEHVEARGGEPLRCCLRDATPGERMILFNHEPVLPAPSPYREVGAVYAHAEPCDGARPSEYPTDWYGRPQVLRAYDERGWIHPATRTHDGTDPVGQIKAVLDHPGVVEIHSRNIAYGCYMFSVTRR